MVVVGQRLLTFLGLTSLVATMMMVTRYNVISNEGPHPSPLSRHHQPRLDQIKVKQLSANKFKVIFTNQSGQQWKYGEYKERVLSQSAAASNRDTNLVLNINKPGQRPVSDQLQQLPYSKQQQPISESDLVNSEANLLMSSPTSALRSPNLGSFSSSTSLPSSSSGGNGQVRIGGNVASNKPSPILTQVRLQTQQSSSKLIPPPTRNHSSDNAVTANKQTKITFNSADLKSTEQFVIDKPGFCDSDKGATTDMLVVVTSAVNHFEAREAIRQTWGKFAVERGALLLFLLGSTKNESLQAIVFQEEAQYNDLLQGSFIDDYYNLTLKTISLMRWVNETCNQVKFVLKVDDDMFVNMQMMVDFSETRTFSKAIIGKLARKWRPHRDPKSKWYVPAMAYNGTLYPNFATGPAYMFTGDATSQLLETSLRLTPIYLEDVYMTGIVAEKANIRRLNHALIKNVRLRVDECTFKRFMTSHKHTPAEILSLWKLVYESPPKACSEPKAAPKATSDKSSKLQPVPPPPKQQQASRLGSPALLAKASAVLAAPVPAPVPVAVPSSRTRT